MISRLFKSQPKITTEQKDEFRQLCEHFAQVLKANGFNHLPYRNPELTRFMEHADPVRVLDVLRDYVAVVDESAASGEKFTDTKKLLWRFIKRFGATPQSDIMDLVKGEKG